VERSLLTLVVGPINAAEASAFSGRVATFAAGDVTGTVLDYKATISWGDGASDMVSPVPISAGGFSVNGTHTYAKEGVYNLSVVLNGTGGTSATGIGVATVSDAPVIVTGSKITPTATQAFSGVVASFTDAGPDLPTQYTVSINWGDGTTSSGTVAAKTGGPGFDVSGTHTYATPGVHTVGVTVTNLAGTMGTATTSATVADPPPTIIAQAISPITSFPFSGPVATFTDANPSLTASSFAATIDWGDGTASPTSAGTVTGSAGSFTVSGVRTYNAVGDFPVKVTVFRLTDNVQASATGLAVVNNPVITPTGLTIAPATGLPFIGTVATFTDTLPGSVPANFSATIDWGDGHTSTGIVSNKVGGGFNVTGTNTYSTANKSYPVLVTITRIATNQSVIASGTANVSDAVLTASGQNVSAEAGRSFTATVATFTDTNPSAKPTDFTATIDWGDSQTSAGTVAFKPGGSVASGTAFIVNGTHTYALAGSDPIHVTLTRTSNGQTAAASATATVSPSAINITATGTTITPYGGVPFTGAVVAMFTASPPATADSFVATIAWGDGQTTAGRVVSNGAGGFNVVGDHTYGAVAPGALGSSPEAITVTILRAFSGQTAATASSTAYVQARAFTGGLDPLYDTGPSNTDGVTRINQPKFSGTAYPYSLVQIYSQRATALAPVLLGQSLAGADGSWSVYSGPLADGFYAITATVTPPSGSPLNTFPLPPLIIDTAPPRILALGFDRSTGTVAVTYHDDLAVMDFASIRNSRNYILSGRNRRGRTVTEALPVISAQLAPKDPHTVVVTISAAQLAAGQATLRIVSGGVTDLAGNALAGNSGPNHSSGDYVTRLTSTTSSREVQARARSAK
jgi:hypothetical protein